MLQLTYWPEDDWHGELQIAARHAGFAGKASAWFNRAEISQFAAELRALANGEVAAAALRGGYFSDSTTSSTPVETHVGISVARQPVRFIASVELADPGDAIQPQSARLQLEIAWAALFWAADAIEAMLEIGGTAELKVVQDSTADPDRFVARHPVSRPFSPLYLTLRARLLALIEQMERSSPVALPPADRQLGSAEFESYSPGRIFARIDWDRACLLLDWGNGADSAVLDLAELKIEALRAGHPRACFESHAAYLLSDAQSHLTDFFRDGPTDDIPYHRHVICVRGLQGGPAQTCVSNIVFSYDETPL